MCVHTEFENSVMRSKFSISGEGACTYGKFRDLSKKDVCDTCEECNGAWK